MLRKNTVFGSFCRFFYFLFSIGYPFVYFEIWKNYVVITHAIDADKFFFFNLPIYPASFFLMASRDGIHYGGVFFASVFINFLIFYVSYKIYTNLIRK